MVDHGLLFCEEEMSPLSCGNAEVLDESPGVDDEESSPHPLLAAVTGFLPRDDEILRAVLLREQSQMPDFESYSPALRAHTELAQARALAVSWMLKVHSQIEFEAKTIQRMELVVLKSLEWRMSGVTALEYVDDLLHRLDISRQIRASMLARITELILGTLPEAEFLAFRPSAIALAALSCALDEILPLQADAFQKRLLASLPVDQEILQRCYRLIEDVIIDPVAVSNKSSKSPPSPLTVIELFQTGDCSGTQVHLRKRRLDVENHHHPETKRARAQTDSIWDLF